jgi:uncharacterized protein YwgA
MQDNNAEKIISRVFHQLGFANINMQDFQDRLRYQKIVYLMQNFGLSLGYGYGWYVRGPYSPDLTKTLFRISGDPELFSQGKQITFKEQETVVSRINEFKNILGNDINNPIFLEVLASMVFIKNTFYSKKIRDNELKEILLKMKPRLKHEPDLDITIERACSKISAFN